MPQKYNFKQRYEMLLDKIENELAEEKIYDSLGNLIQDNKNLFDMYIKTTPEEMELIKKNYNSQDEAPLNKETDNYWKELIAISRGIATKVGQCAIQEYNISPEKYISETKKMLTHKISVEDRDVYIKKLDEIEKQLLDLKTKLENIYETKDSLDKVQREVFIMVDVIGENLLGYDRNILQNDLMRYLNVLDDIDKIMAEGVMKFYHYANKKNVYVSTLMDVLYFILNNSRVPKNERKTIPYVRGFESGDKNRKNESVELWVEVKKPLSPFYQVKLEQYPDMKSKIEQGKSRKRQFKEFLEEQIQFNDGLDVMYIYMTEKHTCIAQSWSIYWIMQSILDAKLDVKKEKDDKATIEKVCNIAKQISRCNNLCLRYYLIEALEQVVTKKCYEPDTEIDEVLENVESVLAYLINNFNKQYDEFCRILIYFFCEKCDYLFGVEKANIAKIDEKSKELSNLNKSLIIQKGKLRGKEKCFYELKNTNKGIFAQRYNVIWSAMIKGERDLLWIEDDEEGENKEKENNLK